MNKAGYYELPQELQADEQDEEEELIEKQNVAVHEYEDVHEKLLRKATFTTVSPKKTIQAKKELLQYAVGDAKGDDIEIRTEESIADIKEDQHLNEVDDDLEYL